ncbi:hypothetical protein BJ085DRAFT_22840 [Dimargaris cristalligena]|uniref:Ubiquitin carboxyl-terminal hydrolase n=1 Tax=Dimargaris cristalligena TaxID=215637 RepID=A0A4V1J4E1_9FUNG|nr:hypothetical protein BJ085DRAFT_22840 [Dimargaris cristalligena]|eukprot:RKP35239.1 hypothetical protein BJ085DRAFT_22840 [Dimargaris cristalligena]
MADTGDWCLIESDPGVFTELIANMGVKGTQVEEVYSLDDASLSALKPIYGLIFLFKWQSDSQTPRPSGDVGIDSHQDTHVFFAKQVINNACATQAILSILLNTPGIELGDELRQFKEFTHEFSPELKGLAISNSDVIRTVHNSFARSDLFVNDEPASASDSNDVFHFISYVPVAGCLYELDGLKDAPVNHGSCTDEDWLQKARPLIQARMARYATSEIRFNLLAVMESRHSLYQKRMDEIERILQDIQLGKEDIQELQARIIALEDEKSQLSYKLTLEQLKLRRYKDENVLRKHNFIPLVYNLIRQLAKKNQLGDLISDAKLKKRRQS